MTTASADILETAMNWAKAEMFSSAFFAAIGIGFLLASFGFGQMGKTETAKAYVLPLLVVGGLLIIIGVGLVISNQMRLSGFAAAYEADAAGFVTMELARVEQTIDGYTNNVFRVIPVIIIVCAGLFLVMRTPVWQASSVAVIAMMAIILLIDTNATARLGDYKAKLLQAEQTD